MKENLRIYLSILILLVLLILCTICVVKFSESIYNQYKEFCEDRGYEYSYDGRNYYCFEVKNDTTLIKRILIKMDDVIYWEENK